MTKEEFINRKISELKKSMYGEEPDLMTEKEELFFRNFLSKTIDDLKQIANGNKK